MDVYYLLLRELWSSDRAWRNYFHEMALDALSRFIECQHLLISPLRDWVKLTAIFWVCKLFLSRKSYNQYNPEQVNRKRLFFFLIDLIITQAMSSGDGQQEEEEKRGSETPYFNALRFEVR